MNWIQIDNLDLNLIIIYTYTKFLFEYEPLEKYPFANC